MPRHGRSGPHPERPRAVRAGRLSARAQRRSLVKLEDASFGYDARDVFARAQAEIQRGDKIYDNDLTGGFMAQMELAQPM